MGTAARMAAPVRHGSARGAVRVCGILLASALLGALAGCGSGGDGTPGDSAASGISSLPGALYDPPKPTPALRLTDAEGRPFDLASERGHVVLLFFGFTECPDICPVTLRRWAEVHSGLGADTSRVRFVFVSVDPEHDTPAVAAEYARKFHPSFVGLSGTPAEIEQIALAWGVSKGRAHTTQVFVVNPEGLVPWGYGRSVEAGEIVRGVRMLSRTPTTG